MIKVERGEVKNGGITFSEPLGLPEGTQVTVTIEAVPATGQSDDPAQETDFDSLRFFGMWAAREDMQDSTAWVRQERERWQQLQRIRCRCGCPSGSSPSRDCWADHLCGGGRCSSQNYNGCAATGARTSSCPLSSSAPGRGPAHRPGAGSLTLASGILRSYAVGADGAWM